MNIALPIAALSSALLLCGCTKGPATSEQNPPPPPQPVQVSTEGFPKTVAGRLILATAPATPDGKRTYEVAIGECSGNECPMLVSLLEGEKVVDQSRTEWASTDREPRPDELEPGWGVGDLVGKPAAVTVWATGDEEKYLGTAIRVVSLADGVIGLLIDQRTGFEHIKRRHELFVVADSKLVKAWQTGEGAGPVSSTTAIAKTDGGSEAVVYFEGFAHSGNRPDTMTAATIAWDGGRVVERQAPVPAAAIGGFPTVQAARRYQAQNKECAGWYWVLPASQFDGADQQGFALALPSATRQGAEARSAEISQCAKGKKAAVVSMR